MSTLRKDVLNRMLKCNKNISNLPASNDLSPLEWDSFFSKYEELEINSGKFCAYFSEPPCEEIENLNFLLIHGAGLTSLSWACFVKELTKSLKCRSVAVDLRGHGFSCVHDDLDIESLSGDIIQLFDILFNPDQKVVVIGHSLGGSVGVRVADRFPERVVGLIVLDAVEGLIKEFNSELIRVNSDLGTIFEWRTDLKKTKKYWIKWFDGMSNGFLRVRAKKMLILTTAENLDNSLMIGHMQGKFQLVLLHNCGHLIHEDVPDQVVEAVSKFVKWHKFI
ncbi:protein phosphatase methylesterase 1-like [Octopus sinensis]|uniref:protein phosphatase methylesterase-1 n=1 Tax=Octopus sinensis TaxID=2607531 RepID=A0A7E6EHT8_9MOLL|nr:protein phosphatase methylesterase 1-like [Octopus sinensis]